MKTKYIIAIGLIILILALAGCKQQTTATENNTADQSSSEVIIEKETVDSSEIAVETPTEEPNVEEQTTENVTEEPPAVVEENTTETTTNDSQETADSSAAGTVHDVTIENMAGNPEDLDINIGDTIRWTNKMPNFAQIIIILPKNEDGTYAKKEINVLNKTLTLESYSYTFNDEGTFKWGSKTNFDKINGIITVKK